MLKKFNKLTCTFQNCTIIWRLSTRLWPR